MCHPLHLNPASPFAADVDIFAGGADTCSYLSRAPVEEPYVLCSLGQFIGGKAVGVGHRLYQRHAQAVSLVYAFMADVRHLAAGVLFEAQLYESNLFVLKLQLTLDADDRRPLEACRYAAVEVLFPGDVHFAYHIHLCSEGYTDGYLQGLRVDGERRCIVDLIGAGRLIIETVGYLLAGLELHEGGAVIYSHLAERGPHMAYHLGIIIVVVMVYTSRTAAEELALCLQLLVHLQSRFETYPLIIIKRSLLPADITYLIAGLLVILQRIETGHRVRLNHCNLRRSPENWKRPNKESLRNFQQLASFLPGR